MRPHTLLLARDCRGTAVIELAIIAPVLALVVAGIVDVANAYSHKLQLEQGAQRAIEKVMQTTELDTVEATLKTEVICQVNGTNENGSCRSAPVTAGDVTVTYRLECKSGVSISSSQTSTDAVAFDTLACAADERETRYLSISVAGKYTPMFPIHFSGLNASDGTYHMSATAGMRTQ